MEQVKQERSGTWDNDPEIMDARVMTLLLSLAEQHGKSLGPSMEGALRYAARRLWELWNEDEDGGEGDESGPLTIDGGAEGAPAGGTEELPEIIRMFG